MGWSGSTVLNIIPRIALLIRAGNVNNAISKMVPSILRGQPETDRAPSGNFTAGTSLVLCVNSARNIVGCIIGFNTRKIG